MGLDAIALKLLVMNRNRGGRLGRTVTLGRQGIHISEDFVRVGAQIAEPYRHENFYHREFYCEKLLQDHFGADLVDSIDYSDFEGATITHDLNTELPVNLRSQYDTVIDLGTSEHVFDVAQCLKNAALLVKESGTILHVLPANNYCGHGFWQFSPEVFFSFYRPDRGFSDTEVYVADADGAGVLTQIEAPDQGRRLEFRGETRLFVVVRTVKDSLMARNADVQQSDYVFRWNSSPGNPGGRPTNDGSIDSPAQHGLSSQVAGGLNPVTAQPEQERTVPNTTLVTAFFNVGRNEWASHGRSDDTYFEWFSNLAELRNPLIVFTSPDLVERVSSVASEHRSFGQFHVVPVDDFREGMIQLRNAMASCMANEAFPRFSQHHVVVDPKLNPVSMADYFVVNLKKTWFVERTLLEFDVTTPYVGWIDFGFIREPGRIPASRAWNVDFDPSRIHKFTLRPLPDDLPVFDIARRGDRFVVGNAMVGPADPRIWRELSELRQTVMWSLVNCGLVDDDQTVMLASIRERSDMFEVHPINDWHEAIHQHNIDTRLSR